MSVSNLKNNIQKLVYKLDSINEKYDEKNTSLDFIHPFFEELGWDFKTDVKSDKSGNSPGTAFQIDGVTRFYLKEFPLNLPLESFKDEITSLISFAFNKGVTWAVVTNFKEIRVYNTESTGRTLASMQHFSLSASEYVEKFKKLSDLTKKQFSLNVLDSNAEYFGKKPKRIPIDKQLLQDLLQYRDLLLSDIIKENSISEKDASQASQKILNRLIFIRSCGDRQIEERYLKSSVLEWQESQDKKLIQYLQVTFSYFRGRYGSTLFEKHPCDDLIINDSVLVTIIDGLYQSRQKAIQYNFANIEHDTLGKIYENYLGTVQQKKDGAYYTPSYISKYICENTIIPYLSKSNVTNIHDLISEYAENLEDLESKIQNVKILDPACGTGEFLIRAIDVLLEISQQIQEQKEMQGHYQTSNSSSRKAPRSLKKKRSGTATFQTFDKDIENQKLRTIIRNNIHGVDINEEAIEITQLNLFLKLATSSQQLMDVSKNIRVGNSLISDSAFDQRAFSWNTEFPNIFGSLIDDKGFDIIVGNPPYVNLETLPEKTKTGLKKFPCFSGKSDLLYFFYNQGIDLLKSTGLLGFITSRYFMEATYAKKLRRFILDSCSIQKIFDLSAVDVFKDIGIHTVIFFLKKESVLNSKFLFKNVNNLKDLNDNNSDSLLQSKLTDESWVLGSIDNVKIFNKINQLKNIEFLGDIATIEQGQKSGLNEAFVVSEQILMTNSLERDHIRKLVKNSFIHKYYVEDRNLYLIYATDDLNENNAPNIIKYLEKFREKLSQRAEACDGAYTWYRLQRPRSKELFDAKEKLVVPYRADCNKFGYDNSQRFNDGGDIRILVIQNLEYDIKFILAILNSKLMDYYYRFIGRKKGTNYEYFVEPLEKIPIKKISNNSQKQFICEANELLKLYETYFNVQNGFLNQLESNFKIKTTKKTNDSFQMSFSELLKELKKQKIHVSYSEQELLDDGFSKCKKIIIQIDKKIKKKISEIDSMVFDLYEITNDEKQLIDSNFN